MGTVIYVDFNKTREWELIDTVGNCILSVVLHIYADYAFMLFTSPGAHSNFFGHGQRKVTITSSVIYCIIVKKIQCFYTLAM